MRPFFSLPRALPALWLVLLAPLVTLCCIPSSSSPHAQESTTMRSAPETGTQLAEPPPEGLAVATFAGGCFWCMEGPFESLPGVIHAIAGYTGGPERSPTYRQVAGGMTGHTEAVQITYDPAQVEYSALLDIFWRNMDPTDAGGQFADRGPQYRPAIFVHGPEQRAAAEASKAALAASGRFSAPIVVPVEEARDFWIAEGYHQNYYRTNEGHYRAYRRGSGRAGFLERTWGEGP